MMRRVNSSAARAFSLLACLGLLGTVLLGTPTRNSASATTFTAQTQTEKKEVKVWVNTRSGVYHCPGSRWYGKTKQGECEAIKDGNRAAYGKPCGSDCK
jgi:hypothetical protein